MDRRLWVALDVPELPTAERLLKSIAPHRDIKVGMELFYRLGPDFIRDLVDRGYHIFLDLKCHDIPNTVARAVDAVSDLGAELLTVHAAGGFDMMNAAREASGGRLSLVAVTVLTSLNADALKQVGLDTPVAGLAAACTRTAMQAGLAGVVTSAGEARALRSIWPGARIVVPGIRLPSHEAGDQKRVFTPEQAKAAGATDLVVGRPITRADNPKRALEQFLERLG